MWSEALRVLEQADRLHRQFFLAHEPASWEPPVDIVERGGELRLQVALPGVPPDSVTVAADADGITLCALRSFPCREQIAQIHRVEIPYGRFERRIEFPVHLYEFRSKTQLDGILTLTFRRKEGA
jgi:HSP20 family molecular chaperone IbpA